MRRKIILNMAVSLDGFIAGEDGSYDWIAGNGLSSLNTKQKWDQDEFLKRVDTVVMGYHCYRQAMHLDFTEQKVYIASSHGEKDYANYHFIQGDLAEFIKMEKQEEGKDIYLFGGGIAAAPLIGNNLIDEYVFGIIPIILGKGIPLFRQDNPAIPLTLKEYFVEDGICVLHYVRRA
ncbi:dihydrofolate reductase family protein [Anaerolentibacter hominis]|uniref:dihydrofolate reductase family protein n=1 Tax=Anaerolentibacter hominis TaxID=3079009 RepID=UPI0031B8A923